MTANESLEFRDGLCVYRPRGKYSLVETVDLISRAIARCRDRGVGRLLVDATGVVDLPVPTLVDRFLMVEDWADEAQGMVIVAMVAPLEHIEQRKFGVSAAEKFGLMCNVYSSEQEASKWLLETAIPAAESNAPP